MIWNKSKKLTDDLRSQGASVQEEIEIEVNQI